MFAEGSPPPLRAATYTARQSLVKSLPRLASTSPFRCAILAEWECPAISIISPVVQSRRSGGREYYRPVATSTKKRGPTTRQPDRVSDEMDPRLVTSGCKTRVTLHGVRSDEGLGIGPIFSSVSSFLRISVSRLSAGTAAAAAFAASRQASLAFSSCWSWK
jgi:hypothetical protein